MKVRLTNSLEISSEFYQNRWIHSGIATLGFATAIIGMIGLNAQFMSFHTSLTMTVAGSTLFFAIVCYALSSISKSKRQKNVILPATVSVAQITSSNTILPSTKGGIYFYKSGSTSFLGNFHPCKIVIWGQEFQCAEAAFQWRKAYLGAWEQAKTDEESQKMEEFFRDPNMKGYFTDDGETAFQRNSEFRKYGISSSWDSWERIDVMYEIIKQKFENNPDLKKMLLSTKGLYLLEHNNRSGKDNYWSDNYDGSGKNMLGRIIMCYRDGHSVYPDSNDMQALSLISLHSANARALGPSIH